jgi:hypothetical protein
LAIFRANAGEYANIAYDFGMWWTWMNLQWDVKPSSSLEITQKT